MAPNGRGCGNICGDSFFWGCCGILREFLREFLFVDTGILGACCGKIPALRENAFCAFLREAEGKLREKLRENPRAARRPRFASATKGSPRPVIGPENR